MQLCVLLVAVFALLASGALAKSVEESKSIDEVYAEAVAEGGRLVMYHGRDTSDFPRWAKAGDLLEYTAKFPQIHPTLKDTNGAWMAYSIHSFGTPTELPRAITHGLYRGAVATCTNSDQLLPGFT
ncbi:hypothetical protein PRIC1_009455 [Phytophthora ramorum]